MVSLYKKKFDNHVFNHEIRVTGKRELNKRKKNYKNKGYLVRSVEVKRLPGSKVVGTQYDIYVRKAR